MPTFSYFGITEYTSLGSTCTYLSYCDESKCFDYNKTKTRKFIVIAQF